MKTGREGFVIKPPRPSLTTGYGAVRVGFELAPVKPASLKRATLVAHGARPHAVGRRPRPGQARGSQARAAGDPRDRTAQAQGLRRFFRALAAENFAALLAGI